MKALMMTDLRKKGEVPLSPKDRHSQNIGTGNYNRFAPLMPPPPARGRLNSKRKLDDGAQAVAPKTPRLDANVVFSQLKVTEDAMSEIRSSFADAVAVGETCYTATDGAMGEAFFKLSKTINLLIENQEKVLSTETKCPFSYFWHTFICNYYTVVCTHMCIITSERKGRFFLTSY